jgi:hypothetical protein
VFSEWQPVYAEHGIATIPCDETKRPLVRNPQKFGCKASAEIAAKFSDAQAFGYYTGPQSGITVLDVDTPDESILAAALARHGQTPLLVRTGSGKFHALYRHNGERRSIRPWEGQPIDLLGATGLCIAPPSIGGKGQYEIIQGGLDDLDRLPIMRELEDRFYNRHHTGPRPRGDWSAMREGNGRNNQLWWRLMQEANHCDTYEQLLNRAHTLNEQFGEPMQAIEVIGRATSAWNKTIKGENWIGRGRERQAEIDGLIAEPYTVALLEWCKVHHGRDNTFMLADGLSKVLGWPRRAVPNARRSLVTRGLLIQVKAGNGFSGASRYRWPGGHRARTGKC